LGDVSDSIGSEIESIHTAAEKTDKKRRMENGNSPNLLSFLHFFRQFRKLSWPKFVIFLTCVRCWKTTVEAGGRSSLSIQHGSWMRPKHNALVTTRKLWSDRPIALGKLWSS